MTTTTDGRAVVVDTKKIRSGAVHVSLCVDGRKAVTFDATHALPIRDALTLATGAQLGMGSTVLGETPDGREIRLFFYHDKLTFCVGPRDAARRVLSLDFANARMLAASLAGQTVPAALLVTRTHDLLTDVVVDSDIAPPARAVHRLLVEGIGCPMCGCSDVH